MRTLVRRRKLLTLGLLLAAVVAGGTLGYVLITGCSLIDAFYMTIISVTTVGYREVVPLQTPGKIFTIRVVSPYELSSHRIVRMVQKPNVVDFFDIVLGPRGVGLSLEERAVAPGSDLDGRTIRQAGFRERYNAIVVAVRREGEMIFNPVPDFALRSGDILIVIGERERLLAFGA